REALALRAILARADRVDRRVGGGADHPAFRVRVAGEHRLHVRDLAAFVSVAHGDDAATLDRRAVGLTVVEVVEVGDAVLLGSAGEREAADEREAERRAKGEASGMASARPARAG